MLYTCLKTENYNNFMLVNNFIFSVFLQKLNAIEKNNKLESQHTAIYPFFLKSTMETKNAEKFLNYEDLAFLGAGSFAQVRKARYNNQIVAVKILMPTHDSNVHTEFMKEVNELSRSNHENIIKILDYGLTRGHINKEPSRCMIIEFADMGSLHHVLHDEPKHPYDHHHAISWLTQTARAVNYLHTRGPKPTIHRLISK